MNFDRDVAFPNKIRIIDLLQRIANGEETPDKVKWEDTIYYYSKLNKSYYTNLTRNGEGIGCTLLNDMSHDIDNLNDEVEIIEEEKKIPEPQKDILKVDDLIPPVDENMYKIWTQTIKNHNKINEICDYLKSKGE